MSILNYQEKKNWLESPILPQIVHLSNAIYLTQTQILFPGRSPEIRYPIPDHGQQGQKHMRKARLSKLASGPLYLTETFCWVQNNNF